jgi:hypothetical protein
MHERHTIAGLAYSSTSLAVLPRVVATMRNKNRACYSTPATGDEKDPRRECLTLAHTTTAGHRSWKKKAIKQSEETTTTTRLDAVSRGRNQEKKHELRVFDPPSK